VIGGDNFSVFCCVQPSFIGKQQFPTLPKGERFCKVELSFVSSIQNRDIYWTGQRNAGIVGGKILANLF
jgi:hypothetical protein